MDPFEKIKILANAPYLPKLWDDNDGSGALQRVGRCGRVVYKNPPMVTVRLNNLYSPLVSVHPVESFTHPVEGESFD